MGKKDVSSNSFVGNDGAAWSVYEDYEAVRRDDGWWVEARGKLRKNYRPLSDSPAMFHSLLAKIAPERFEKGPKPLIGDATLAVEFAREYGVLGATPGSRPKRAKSRTGAGSLVLVRSYEDPGDLMTSIGGGSRKNDSVAAFVREAWTLRAGWTFYQMAMEADQESLDTIHRLDSEFAAVRYGDEFAERGGSAFEPTGIPRLPKRLPSAGLEARVWGTNAAAEITQEGVSRWCSPAIYRPYGNRGQLYRGWGFESLAGAAWLQMWLRITAGDEDPLCENLRCPHGNPPIVREPGRTLGRPKLYCTDYCRKDAHDLKRAEQRRHGARRRAHPWRESMPP